MWLLSDEVARDMRARLDLGIFVTDALQNEFAQLSVEARSDQQPRNMRIAGDTAEIDVVGLLTPKPDFWAWLFGYGNTTYEQIEASLAIAAADPGIKRVVFNVDSPGGQVAGLFECVAAIGAFKKPKSVKASLAASAAYVIAAMGGKIEARNNASTFGSIGVVTTHFVDENVVDITSTKAPDKRPDPTTEEGKAKIREYLDALHELMVSEIAKGRNTTESDIDANFGRGAVVVARDAKRRGMIDKIAGPSLRAVTISEEPEEDATAADPVAGATVADSSVTPETTAATAGGAAPVGRKKPMTKEELKAQHPELYEAVRKEGREEGHAVGLAEGETKERKRVNAHLKMGTSCGDMSIAVAAVASGADFSDPEMQSQYMDARMNRADQLARQRESDDAGRAVDNAATEPAALDLGDQVAARLCHGDSTN